jgi:hypothetical protein
MTTITSGTSLAFTCSVRGQTFTVIVNSGQYATVSGGTNTISLGPTPTRRTFGPYEVGDSRTITASLGDILVDIGQGSLSTIAGAPDISTVDIPALNSPTNAALALKPVKAQAFAIGAFVATVADGDLLRVRAPFALTVTKTSCKSVAGTTTVTTKNGASSLGTAVSASTTEASQTYSGAFAAGDYIVVTAASSSSCTGLTVEIDYTRTLA